MDGGYYPRQHLVQANPIPRGWHEVFLDGVGQTRSLVGAPHTHRRNVHHRRVETLPQLRGGGGRKGGRQRGGEMSPCARWWRQWAVPHLQAEGRHHGLVVADSVAHVTGVFVLRDQERILVLSVFGRGQRCLVLGVFVVIVVFRRRSFGFDAPQDSVRPGWFSFLPAECNNISFVF